MTSKFNQDPLERFFGTIRQAGVQNDHPTMPTFLQLYRLLSVQKLIKPPKCGNCEITESAEKPCLTVEDIKSIFASDAIPEGKISNLTTKLDGLIKTDRWECEDIFPETEDDPAIIDCVIYFVAGFVARKFRQKSNCVTCRDALGCTFQDVQENLSNLITTKTRGRLTYPNVHLYRLLHAAEDYFSTHAKSTHVYEATIDHVLETHNLSFPCEVHKQETLAGILHYYVLMRMRQFCSQENRATQKASREKKKSKRCIFALDGY